MVFALVIITIVVLTILINIFSPKSDDGELPFDDSESVKTRQNQDFYKRQVSRNTFNLNDKLNIHPGNNNLGAYGEFLTFKKIVNACGGTSTYFKVLNNFVLNTKNGTTEVDSIVIHETGIYVFESKNFSGAIYGNSEDRQWTQVLENGNKKQFYNPVWQNHGHMSAIKHVLGYNFTYYSIIVFSERCNLKQITGNMNGAIIVQRQNLELQLKKLFSQNRVLSNNQIDEMCRKLQKSANITQGDTSRQDNDLPF